MTIVINLLWFYLWLYYKIVERGVAMKIKMYLDFVCPYSYIGKHKLTRVIEENFNPEDFEIELASYQLNPDIKYTGEKMIDRISQNENIDVEFIKRVFENIKLFAEAEGLEYNLDNIYSTNTLDAHRLMKYASESGHGVEMSDAIMNSYFVKGEDISNRDVLLRLATEIGLDEAGAEAVIDSDKFTDEVEYDMQHAYEIDMENTPVFIFDKKYAITGAQDDSVFIEVITDLLKGE